MNVSFFDVSLVSSFKCWTVAHFGHENVLPSMVLHAYETSDMKHSVLKWTHNFPIYNIGVCLCISSRGDYRSRSGTYGAIH